jgi:serine/threonine protein kinase
MEWVKGASLLSLLESGIANASDREVLANSIILALAGLHALGFAHRDIKPANILMGADGSAFLVDFGFSKKIGAGGQSMVGQIKGTPAYMAPESWQGRGNIDFIKADVFALGKVLQEMALGSGWEAMIAPLLAMEPADRPVSAAAFWEMRRDTYRSRPLPRISAEGKASIAQAASLGLSRQLLSAAKQLLFAKRGAEAYWLLAECIQEDPDAVEALQMMGSFPELSRKKKRQRLILSASASAAFILALAAAFHFGKRSEQANRFPIANVDVKADENARALLLPPPRGKKSIAPAGRFRESDTDKGKLTGLLFLENTVGCDSLYLDSRPLSLPLPPAGLPLEAGEHSLLCKERDGRLIYREKAALLPFQRKIIRMRYPADPIAKKEA